MKKTHYKVWTKADDHKLACHLDDLYNGKATEVRQKPATTRKPAKRQATPWTPYNGTDKAKYFQKEEKQSCQDICRNLLNSIYKQDRAIARAMA